MNEDIKDFPKLTKYSRYGDPRTLQTKAKNEYYLTAPCEYYRSDTEGMIDFEGGPCLQPGQSLEFFGIYDTIERIEHLEKDIWIIKTSDNVSG